MLIYYLFYFALILGPALPKHLTRYANLEEDDQHLFRTAYETPSYDHDEYQEEEDLPLGKLDLLKDGLWAIKAKIKELQAFDKAFAANLLSTKLKLKDLVLNHLGPIKKHEHLNIIEKKKPTYSYQVPPQTHYEVQYAAPHYPAPQYTDTVYGHDPYYGH